MGEMACLKCFWVNPQMLSSSYCYFPWRNILSKTHNTAALNNQNRTLDLWNGIQGTLSVPFKLFNITQNFVYGISDLYWIMPQQKKKAARKISK